MSRKVQTALFLLAAAVILFWRLGGAPLFDPDEGRYSNIAHTMLTTGDWLTPRMNGISHYHKPPLSNWLVAGSFKLFGANEFAARFPSVIASLALLATLISLGAFLFGFQAGYFAAWILLTSALYTAISRLVTTDMLLVFMTFFTMNAFARLFFGQTRKVFWFYMAVTGLGLGMLTKGPVAWMITLLPAVIFAVWKRKNPGIAWYHYVVGFVLFWGLSLSWFVVVILKYKEAFDYFINYQLGGRIVTGASGRRHGPWYFLVVLPLGLIPWSIFAPSAARWITKQTWDAPTKEKLLFVSCWFLVPFTLFTLIKTKLATYIVPTIPPLALLFGFFWANWQTGKVEASAFMKRSALGVGISLMALSAAGVIFISIMPEFIHGLSFLSVVAIAACLAVSGAGLIFIVKKQMWKRLFAAQTASLCVLAITVFTILPALEYKNSRVFAEKLAEIKQPGDKVITWRTYFASLPFYLRERIITVAFEMETIFEKKETVEGYVYEHSGDLTQILKDTNERVFILLSKKEYEELIPVARVPLYPILETAKIKMVSNRPEPA